MTTISLPCDADVHDTDEFVGASRPAERTQGFAPLRDDAPARPMQTFATTNVHVNTDTRVSAERLPGGTVTLRFVDPVSGFTGVSVLTDDDGVRGIVEALRGLYRPVGA